MKTDMLHREEHDGRVGGNREVEAMTIQTEPVSGLAAVVLHPLSASI